MHQGNLVIHSLRIGDRCLQNQPRHERKIDWNKDSFHRPAHGKAITADVVESVLVYLEESGSISGDANGTWKLSGANRAILSLDGTIYKGVFIRPWNDDNQTCIMTFTALAGNGVAVWGSKVAR